MRATVKPYRDRILKAFNEGKTDLIHSICREIIRDTPRMYGGEESYDFYDGHDEIGMIASIISSDFWSNYSKFEPTNPPTYEGYKSLINILEGYL